MQDNQHQYPYESFSCIKVARNMGRLGLKLLSLDGIFHFFLSFSLSYSHGPIIRQDLLETYILRKVFSLAYKIHILVTIQTWISNLWHKYVQTSTIPLWKHGKFAQECNGIIWLGTIESMCKKKGRKWAPQKEENIGDRGWRRSIEIGQSMIKGVNPILATKLVVLFFFNQVVQIESVFKTPCVLKSVWRIGKAYMEGPAHTVGKLRSTNFDQTCE